MITTALLTVTNKIRTMGGRIFIVGGAVRDFIMFGKITDDIDLEVFNLSGKQLLDILTTFGTVTVAGKFSIFTLTVDGMKYDFSLPRRETKTGKGYTAFDIEIDPTMTLEEASARRDFTINAMMIELPTMERFDFHGGMQDMIDGIIRPTSEHFAEDPMRVMRGFQFTSRFGFVMPSEGIRMSRSLLTEATTLDSNVLWKIFKKWAKGSFPSMALGELELNHWITLFPALNNLLGIEQDPIWHPEGNAWQHTKLVVEAMSEIIRRESITDEDRIMVLMLAALLHDVGKATTTEVRNGRITSHGHAEAGIIPATEFMSQIGTPHRIRDQVIPLIREHMAHIGLDANARNVRRLAIRIAPTTIEDLMFVIEADHSGRHPLPKGLPAKAKAILDTSRQINVTSDKPEPIIKGRHLIELGFNPGIGFKNILDAAFEAQLDGVFDNVESGKAWVQAFNSK